MNAAARYVPPEIWGEGSSCYIIGGGPSLKGFNWSLLHRRNVIGCNAAFYLGANICSTIVFGDSKFFTKHLSGLTAYVVEGGVVVTNSSRLRKPAPPDWLRSMRKQLKGLSTTHLGWNGSTGASAINLALMHGARTVYLLGFDMKHSADGEANFHNAYVTPAKPIVYKRFLRGMNNVAKDLPKVFPGRSVINLTEDSDLNSFPKESLVEHFAERMVTS